MINAINAIKVATDGFQLWATKDHNRRWFKQIDGTPITNDLPVCIANEFAPIISEIEAERDALRALLLKAGEALEPFAEEAKDWNGYSDDTAPDFGTCPSKFNIGHLRLASSIASEIQAAKVGS